ncbi:MAG: cation:proton antiporter [Planctomycetes bacterium]|nr:cation:proton antiporter [Planctomycetota bacterium]
MQPALIAYLAACLLTYSLSSRWLRKLSLTSAIFFFFAGLPAGPFGLDLFGTESTEAAHLLANITLALVLFVDATHASPEHLLRPRGAPLRLLLLGLPLVVVAGTAVASLLLPGLSLWQAAVLAAVVAPTDAALGQPILQDERVPADIRHILNVESGLNDGLSVPILMVLLCAARTDAHPDMTAYWVRFGATQVVLGPLIGVLVGHAGAKLLARDSGVRGALEPDSRIGVAALAIVSYGLAEVLHGNGLLASFVAGLACGRVNRKAQLTAFADAEGKLLSGLVFFIVGALLLPQAWDSLSPATLAFAIAALTVTRVLPSVVTLLYTGLGHKAILAIGWFGPRGVATVVFALFVDRHAEWENRSAVFAAAMATVTLSIVLHGVTAVPAVRWLASDGLQQSR